MRDDKHREPAERGPSPATGAAHPFHLLYAGPLRREHGLELLGDAFLAARERDPRLHLVIVGDGPAEAQLRAWIGEAAAFLGPLDDDRSAIMRAIADLLVVPSGAESARRAILDAQAGALPVLAVDGGPAAELIEAGRSGCLVAAETEALAAAICGLARRGALLERLATGGLLAARRRPQRHPAAPLAEGVARAA